jgi:hypothetical protein
MKRLPVGRGVPRVRLLVVLLIVVSACGGVSQEEYDAQQERLAELESALARATSTTSAPTTSTEASTTTVKKVSALLDDMADSCSDVLDWQEEYLATDPLKGEENPSFAPIEDAHLRLDGIDDFPPTEYLREEIATLLATIHFDYANSSSQDRVDAGRRWNRAMYQIEVRCRYLDEGRFLDAAPIPDPALISVDLPGAQEAIRACLLWVMLYTDVEDDSIQVMREMSLREARSAQELDPEWKALLDNLYAHYSASLADDFDSIGIKFDAASTECAKAIQVPRRLSAWDVNP